MKDAMEQLDSDLASLEDADEPVPTKVPPKVPDLSLPPKDADLVCHHMQLRQRSGPGKGEIDFLFD